jgi:RNA polymerase sigma-70 factor (ECF subfamily)
MPHHDCLPRASDRWLDQVEPHLPLLGRIALRLTGRRADAEDLMQGLLLKLHVHRHRLAAVQALRPWLVRTLHHHFVDQYRRRQRSVEQGAESYDEALTEALPVAPGGLTGPESCTDQLQLRDYLWAAMEDLPATQREVIAGHDLAGCSLPELALRLGISAHTLKSALTRARDRLRHQLRDHEPVPAARSRRRLGRGCTGLPTAVLQVHPMRRRRCRDRDPGAFPP